MKSKKQVHRYTWTSIGITEKVLQEIHNAKALLATSDTVLGLLAPCTHAGFQALNDIKGRSEKPYLVLVNSLEKAQALMADVTPQVRILMERCWPGPLTLLVKARADLPAWMVGSTGAVGIRIPTHAGLLAVLEHVPGLFSTSANYTGQPTPIQLADLDERLWHGSASIIVTETNDEEEHFSTEPSTLLDCTGPTVTIVRQGAYSRQELEKILNQALGL